MAVKQVSKKLKRSTKTAVFTAKPFAVADKVRHRFNLTHEEMAAYIGLPFRTYQRRAQKGELEEAETAKVEMFRELLDRAVRTFGDETEARDWLTTPNPALGSERPIELLNSIKGYEYVKNTLLQIEYGMF